MKSRTGRHGVYKKLLARDGRLCAYCHILLNINGKLPRNDRMTIDHVVPKAKGGGDNLENLKLACHKCNVLKGHKDLLAYVPTR